jgi:hypothetical protein
MLTLDTFRALLTPAGQAAIAAAESLDLRDDARLATLSELRRHWPPELAAAALETALLRRRARAKFSGADRMYFTREALEQASGELVARHRAARLAGADSLIHDVCCSIGGDALSLAESGAIVRGLDLDPVRIAMAEANAAVYGVTQRATFAVGDALAFVPPPGAWIFFDPARREGGRRRWSPDAYQPPLATIERWMTHASGIAIKVAPGIDYESLPYDVEVEIVSVAGEVKEACLWWGDLRRHARSATLLPDGGTLAFESVPPLPVALPGRYLYEPDGAIIRAHLVEQLGHRLGAAKIDDSIAFLTSDALTHTHFARAWTIRETLPWNLKRLRSRLRELDIGRVIVKKRGSPIDPQELERQLRLDGAGQLTVVLTRALGKPVAILCQPAEHT